MRHRACTEIYGTPPNRCRAVVLHRETTSLPPYCARRSLHRAPRAPPACESGLLSGRIAQMLHYAQTWLPLLSVALIAAAIFALASFISGGAEF
jgi:hypothetical protein